MLQLYAVIARPAQERVKQLLMITGIFEGNFSIYYEFIDYYVVTKYVTCFAKLFRSGPFSKYLL